MSKFFKISLLLLPGHARLFWLAIGEVRILISIITQRL
jgi:hypothetical protein